MINIQFRILFTIKHKYIKTYTLKHTFMLAWCFLFSSSELMYGCMLYVDVFIYIIYIILLYLRYSVWPKMNQIHTWSELLVPLVNMSKERCENKPALIILLIFYCKTNHKNLTFHWTKKIENGGKSHYEINVFLKYTLNTIIGTPRNSYE